MISQRNEMTTEYNGYKWKINKIYLFQKSSTVEAIYFADIQIFAKDVSQSSATVM
jgi:hypothetical protein